MAPKTVKRKSNISEKYGPSEKRDFHVYDKVFAKMRGYPPWPAKITNIKIDSKTKSLKSKCEVYFYGSNQVGQCVFSDIHDYEANKDRFKDVCAQMKSLKTAFLLGLEEIENDNGPLLEEIEDGSVAIISFDDSFVSVEEESSPAMKKSKKTIEKVTIEESSPLDESIRDQDDQEKTDKEEEKETDNKETNEEENKEAAAEEKEDTIEEGASTQADISTQENEKETETAEENNDNYASTSVFQPQAPRNKSLDREPSTKNSIKPDTTPKINKQSNVDTNKPTDEEEIKKSVASNGNNSDTTPASSLPSEEVPNTSLLQTECTLLALEKDIKESVGINRVDFTKALAAINSLLDLELTSLMLKKNPEVVDTFLKLQRYAGERVKYQLPPSTQPTFDEHATVVRNLATRTLDKFSTLFEIYPGRTFMETFRTEMVKFIKRTRDMTPSEVLKLTNDPC